MSEARKTVNSPVLPMLRPFTSEANLKQLTTQVAGNKGADNFPRMEIRPATTLLHYLQRRGIGYQLDVKQYYTKSGAPMHELEAVLNNSKYKVTLFSSEPKAVGDVFIGSGRIYPQVKSNKIGLTNQYGKVDRYDMKNPLGRMIMNKPYLALSHVLNRAKNENFHPRINRSGAVNSTMFVPVMNDDGSQMTDNYTYRGRTYHRKAWVKYLFSPNSGRDLNLLRPDIMRAMASESGFSYNDYLNRYMNVVADPKAKPVIPEVKQDRQALRNTILQSSGFHPNDVQHVMNYVNKVHNLRAKRYAILKKVDVHNIKYVRGQRRFTDQEVNVAQDYMNGDTGLNNVKGQDMLTANEKRYINYYKNHTQVDAVMANRAAFNGAWHPSASVVKTLQQLEGVNQANKDIQEASEPDDPQHANPSLTSTQLDLYDKMSNQAKHSINKDVARNFLKRTIFQSKFYYLRKSFGDPTIEKDTPIARSQAHIKDIVSDPKNTITKDDAQAIYQRMNEVFGNLQGYSDPRTLGAALNQGLTNDDKPLTANQRKLFSAIGSDANKYVGSYDKGFDPNTVINLMNEADGGYMRNYIYTALSTAHYDTNKFLVDGFTREEAAAHPDKAGDVDFSTLSKVEDHVLSFDPSSAKSAEGTTAAAGKETNPFLKNELVRVENDLAKYGVRSNKQYSSRGNSVPSVAIDKNGVIHWSGYRTYSRYVGKQRGSKSRYRQFNEHVEGTLGQVFAPDKLGLVHTHFASGDDLTKIPAYKGYFQPNDPRPGFSTPRMQRFRVKGFYQMMNERLDYTISSQMLRQPPKDVTMMNDPANRIDLTSPRDPVMIDGLYHSEVYGRNLSGDNKDFFKMVDGKPVVGRSPQALRAIIGTFARQVHLPKNLDDVDSASARSAKHFKNPVGDLLSGHNMRTIAEDDYAGVFDPRQSGNGTSQGVNLYMVKGINPKTDIDQTTGKVLHPAATIDLATGKDTLPNGQKVYATPEQIKKNANYLAQQDLAKSLQANKKAGLSDSDARKQIAEKLSQYVTLQDSMYDPKTKRNYPTDHVIAQDHGRVQTVSDNKGNERVVYNPGILDVLSEVHKLDAIKKNKDGTYDYVIPRSPLRSMPEFRFDRYNMGDRSLMAAHYALTAPHSQKARVGLVTTGGFTYDDSCTVSSGYALKNPQINAFDKNGVNFKLALQRHFEHKYTTETSAHLANMVIKKQQYSGKVPFTQYEASAMNARKLLKTYLKNGTYNKADAISHVATLFDQPTDNQLNSALLNATKGQVNPQTSIKQINELAQIAGINKVNQDGKLTKFVISNGPRGKEARAYNSKTDANVPDNDIDPVGFNKLGYRLRPLRKGDKMIEYAGNKATIGLVVDPNMSKQEAAKWDVGNIVKFYHDNPGLDMTMSPFSVVSRDNTGLIHEMHSNAKDVRPLKVVNPQTGKTELKGQSGVMNMMVADIPVDTKTQDYNTQKVMEGRGRNVNGQIGWALQAFGAHHILHAFYADNEKQWQHYRNYLNVVGVDLAEDKNHHLHYVPIDPKRGYVQHHNLGKYHLDEDRQVFTPDEAADTGKDDSPMYAGTPEQFTKLMDGRSGILQLPFPVKLFSGQKTNKLTIMDSSMRRNMQSRDGTIALNDYMETYKKIYTEAQEYTRALTSLDAGGNDKRSQRYLQRAVKRHRINVVTNVNQLQSAVTEKELGGFDGSQQKDSFIRRHLIETRVPNSSTSVVTADPRVRLGHVKVGRRQYRVILGRNDPDYRSWHHTIVPASKVLVRKANIKKMAVNNPQKASGMMKALKHSSYPVPVWKVARAKKRNLQHALATHSDKAASLKSDLANYKKNHTRVLMWRDPALTEGSIRSVQLDEDPSINGVGAAMPPLTDNSFEGDFDGDTYGFVAVPKSRAKDPKVRAAENAALNKDMDHISVQHNLVNKFGKAPASYLNISMDAVNGAVRDGLVPKTHYIFNKKNYKWATGHDYAKSIANTLNHQYAKAISGKPTASDWASLFKGAASRNAQSNPARARKARLAADQLNYLSNDKDPVVLEKYMDHKKHPSAQFFNSINKMQPSAHFVVNANGKPVQDKNGYDVMKPSGTSKDMLQKKFVSIMANKKANLPQKVDATQHLADKCMRDANFASAYVNVVDPKRLTGQKKNVSPSQAKQDDLQAEAASIQNSCDTGAKGNPIKRMTRFNKFCLGLGTRKDLQDVQFAKGTQADLTGVAGSYSQALFSLLRHADPAVAIEVTHPDTQAVLQIKHSPEMARSYKKWLTGPMRDVLIKGNPLTDHPTDGSFPKSNSHQLQTPQGFKRDYSYVLDKLGISINPKLLNKLTDDLSMTDKTTGRRYMIGTQKMMQVASDPIDRNAYGRHMVEIPKMHLSKDGKPEIETDGHGNLTYAHYQMKDGKPVIKTNHYTGEQYKPVAKSMAGGLSSLTRSTKRKEDLDLTDYETDAQEGKLNKPLDVDSASEKQLAELQKLRQAGKGPQTPKTPASGEPHTPASESSAEDEKSGEKASMETETSSEGSDSDVEKSQSSASNSAVDSSNASVEASMNAESTSTSSSNSSESSSSSSASSESASQSSESSESSESSQASSASSEETSQMDSSTSKESASSSAPSFENGSGIIAEAFKKSIQSHKASGEQTSVGSSSAKSSHRDALDEQRKQNSLEYEKELSSLRAKDNQKSKDTGASSDGPDF